MPRGSGSSSAGAGETGISAWRKDQPDLSLIYPTDPAQLSKELAGVQQPPKS